MRRRIFLAIDLPDNIRKKLAEYQRKWPELPARWTKPENLHITLEFLGYVSDEEIGEICKAAKQVASAQSSFTVTLNKICYGPPKKMPPRMIWAEGEKSEELGKLKEALQKALVDSNIRYSPEKRDFSPHITLARIRAWDFRRLDPEERPQIEEEIKLAFDVDSIEVMESKLKKGGPEYIVLESCRLKN